MECFLTGSRAYGTPTKDSDLDLVVSCSSHEAKLLWSTSDQLPSCRFGNLNLIICTNDTKTGPSKFQTWKRVTESLVLRAPVTREEAVAAFQLEGIGANYDTPEKEAA